MLDTSKYVSSSAASSPIFAADIAASAIARASPSRTDRSSSGSTRTLPSNATGRATSFSFPPGSATLLRVLRRDNRVRRCQDALVTESSALGPQLREPVGSQRFDELG